MVVLLDTHIAYWLITEDKRLTDKIKEIIEDADEVWFSQISVFETELKHVSHPKTMLITGKDFREACLESGLRELFLQDEHIDVYDEIKIVHKDPYDRLLVATAKAEDMKLLTCDRMIGKSEEDCVIYIK